MDRETGSWTSSGKIGLPPLAWVNKGLGRQQQVEVQPYRKTDYKPMIYIYKLNAEMNTVSNLKQYFYKYKEVS